MGNRTGIGLPATLKGQVQERNRRRANDNHGRVKADQHSVVARNDRPRNYARNVGRSIS